MTKSQIWSYDGTRGFQWEIVKMVRLMFRLAAHSLRLSIWFHGLPRLLRTRKLTQLIPTHIQFLALNNTQSLCLENINTHQSNQFQHAARLPWLPVLHRLQMVCFLHAELRAMWICDSSSCILSRWSCLIGSRLKAVHSSFSNEPQLWQLTLWSYYTNHTRTHTHTHKPAFHLCPFTLWTLRMTKAGGMSTNTIHFTVLRK